MGAGVYDHGYVLGYERVSDHPPARTARATACGASARGRWSPPPAPSSGRSFAGNDVPGVMLASACATTW